MVTIATFGEPFEANLARGYLESVGIPAFLADEQTMGVAWHLGIALGGVKLQVADEIEYEAREALANRRADLSDDNAGIPETSSDVDVEAQDGVAAALETSATTSLDEVEEVPTRREQNAERAWRGTVVCFFFPPLELYILWLLIQVWSSDERLGPQAKRHALLAALINIPVVVAVLYWLRSFLPI